MSRKAEKRARLRDARCEMEGFLFVRLPYDPSVGLGLARTARRLGYVSISLCWSLEAWISSNCDK